MSEEEIMEGINKTIAFMKEELKAEHSCFNIKELWSLQGLLDLYNKEKEKNKELETAYLLQKDLFNDFEKGYVSKDKIKEIVGLYNNTLQCTRKYNEELANILCDLEELLGDDI